MRENRLSGCDSGLGLVTDHSIDAHGFQGCLFLEIMGGCHVRIE